MVAGFWHTTFFPDDFWHDTFWARFAASGFTRGWWRKRGRKLSTIRRRK